MVSLAARRRGAHRRRRRLAATPLTITDVDRAPAHHVRVSKSGYDVWESDVKFDAGERAGARCRRCWCRPSAPSRSPRRPPGAEAIVNGRIRGMTPTTVGDLPPNDDVTIELRLRGYKVAHQTVSAGRGKRKLDGVDPA